MDYSQELHKIAGNLLFLKIFQTFRIAIQPKSMIIAFLAVVIIFLSGWMLDISNSVIKTDDGLNELDIYLTAPELVGQYIELHKSTAKRAGVFTTLSTFYSQKFNSAVVSLLQLNFQNFSKDVNDCTAAVRWAFQYHTVYAVIFTLIKLAIISLAGGAICRFTALQFSQGQKPGLFEVLRFSTGRFFSLFFSLLVLCTIIAVLGSLIILLGLVANIPHAGELIMSILFPLALILGIVIAIMTIGAIAGFNLMYPAIAYEGTDCFEAVSRSLSYVYTKPWRIVFYYITAIIYGAICYLFVRFFLFLVLFMTRLFLNIGIFVKNSSNEADKLNAIWPKLNMMDFLGYSVTASNNWSESAAAFIIYLCLMLVAAVLISFVVSFSFTANSIIYSLMRNRVDGTNLNEIYIHIDDYSEQLPDENASISTADSARESTAAESLKAESDDDTPTESEAQ